MLLFLCLVNCDGIFRVNKIQLKMSFTFTCFWTHYPARHNSPNIVDYMIKKNIWSSVPVLTSVVITWQLCSIIKSFEIVCCFFVFFYQLQSSVLLQQNKNDILSKCLKSSEVEPPYLSLKISPIYRNAGIHDQKAAK